MAALLGIKICKHLIKGPSSAITDSLKYPVWHFRKHGMKMGLFHRDQNGQCAENQFVDKTCPLRL